MFVPLYLFLLLRQLFAVGVTKDELNHILSRAITLSGGFIEPALRTVKGYGYIPPLAKSPDEQEVIDLIFELEPSFTGRGVFLWGSESLLPTVSARMKPNVALVHSSLPELVIEGAVFEIVTPDVEKLKIPLWVLAAFNLTAEARSFNYSAMLFDDGWGVDRFGVNRSIPDITKLETRIWMLTAAGSYIKGGAEALHFGQMELMGRDDKPRVHTAQLFTLVRDFAAKYARRSWVLLNAHVHDKSWTYDGKLLFDFFEFPSRPKDDLNAGFPHSTIGIRDVECKTVYNHSAGGVTPAGWTTQSLPYLVELDNFGVSSTPGQHNTKACYVWGYDEITWYALEDAGFRSGWLSYALQWLREIEEDGHFQLPGLRVISPGNNSKGEAYFTSYWNDTEAFKSLWS